MGAEEGHHDQLPGAWCVCVCARVRRGERTCVRVLVSEGKRERVSEERRRKGGREEGREGRAGVGWREGGREKQLHALILSKR